MKRCCYQKYQLLLLLSCTSFIDLVHAGTTFQQRSPTWRSLRSSVVLKETRGGEKSSRGSPSSAATEGLKNSIASGLAAACSKTLLAPFDTIKTVQQQVRQEAGGKALSFAEAARVITRRPKGFLELYVSHRWAVDCQKHLHRSVCPIDSCI